LVGRAGRSADKELAELKNIGGRGFRAQRGYPQKDVFP